MGPVSSTLVLFLIGTVAGFMNVMAGGGSTLTLPALIFLGLDASAANGTNRVAIFVQNASAITSFRRENYHAFRTSLGLSLFALPGAIAGAVFAVRVSGDLFEKILGVVMIGVIVSMLLPNPRRLEPGSEREEPRWPVYGSMLLIGFYGGFVQVGVGFLLMAALHHLMRLNLTHVNMHKVFIVFVYTLPALLVFALTGNVNWRLGASLAVGNALGGWWAAKVTVRKGERLIRAVLIAVILLMSLKLLDVF
jgi:uncharacterized membrane protein YfcA